MSLVRSVAFGDWVCFTKKYTGNITLYYYIHDRVQSYFSSHTVRIFQAVQHMYLEHDMQLWTKSVD